MTPAEELKEKLALEEADRNRKIKALKDLRTGPLIIMLHQQEEALEAALRDEARVRDLNIGYLASGTNDCAEVKRILAELAHQAPDVDGKKPTIAERETWLTLQRGENKELYAALERQRTTAFELENLRITSEMAKKRLENIKAVLSIRTAQIEFLTTR